MRSQITVVQGSCDAPNKMGPVLQCTLDKVPPNLLDKMYEQEPMETAKQDRYVSSYAALPPAC